MLKEFRLWFSQVELSQVRCLSLSLRIYETHHSSEVTQQRNATQCQLLLLRRRRRRRHVAAANWKCQNGDVTAVNKARLASVRQKTKTNRSRPRDANGSAKTCFACKRVCLHEQRERESNE